MNALTIRTLLFSDFDAWSPLWLANNKGHGDDQVTRYTWRMITNKKYDVHGLCALNKTDMVGILHYVLHPVAGSITPVCYMQDLFVDPIHRRQGIAAALIKKLADIGEMQKWNRIYWLTEGSNESAQKLYKNVGVKLDFTFHVLPLQILKDL